MKNNRGFVPILILVLIALGAAGYFGYKYFRPTTSINNPTPFPTPTIGINPKTGWKIYTNTKYGYSFEYPSQWLINLSVNGGDRPEQVDQIRIETETDGVILWARAGTTYYKDYADLLNNLDYCRPNSECIEIYSKSKVKLGGLDAVKYTRSQLGPNKVLSVETVKDGYRYSLDLEKFDTLPQEDKTFDQILSTFKFTQ